jgi:aminobenzoyl-glutamate utilization protein B
MAANMILETGAKEAIDKQSEVLVDLAQKIWENPEGPYREFKAVEWTAQALRDAGFAVQVGAAGVPTAIRAEWGSGHPVIGLLGEYDALPAMSQKVLTQKEPVTPGAYGQGCAHNLLGVAHVGAAIGMKAAMEQKGLGGTVVFYGCPAEEVLTGKVFMARNGAFRDLDAVFAFHPGRTNMVTLGTMTGLNTAKFHFKGCTAHAGGDPHNGRSALDAVELMNVGANYLREHVTSDVRIHYVITNGGMAPNIVPDKASVWYYVRALSREAVVDVYNRLLKVAKGASIMTETEFEVEFLGGCYNTLQNKVLAGLIHGVMGEVQEPAWTGEEIAFAAALDEANPAQYKAALNLSKAPEGTHLFTGVMPIQNDNGYGSTDVGDVQHLCPGGMFNTACSNIGAPGHSWQITASAGHSIGMKGMLYAAKVMAEAGVRLLEQPALLEQARAEFDKAMAGRGYICPMPEETPIP